ncbi:MAG: hypothetical protein Tsb002_30590 [Wenzhouxiangellaceae bacterium]
MNKITRLFAATVLVGFAGTLAIADERSRQPAPEADAPPTPESAQPETKESGPEADAAGPAAAMTGERLAELIGLIDAEAQVESNVLQFRFRQRQMVLIYDSAADRMRLMSPIAEASVLDESLMYRMLQANYDAVLDPRYAVARDIVWSAYIHPLAALSDAQFASAVVQVYTAAETFGTTFSSGGIVFGGGDSQEQNQRLLEELNKLLNPTT